MPEQSYGPGLYENNVELGWSTRLHRLKFLTFRYWWIVAICVVVGIALQDYRCVQQASRYTSIARMMVNGRFYMNQQGGGVYSEDEVLFFGTQTALMKSPDTYGEAQARVRALHPDVVVDDSATLDAVQLPRTSIFQLQTTSTNPEYAQYLLDAAIDAYTESKKMRRDRTTNGAVAAITEGIAKLGTEISSDEQQLLDFQKENNVVYIEEQSNSAASYLVGLNNEMARLTKEYDLLKLEDDSANSQGLNAAGNNGSPDATSVENAPIQQANASIAAEQENIEKITILREEYGMYLKDKHPKMIALAENLDKEQKFLAILKTRSADVLAAHRTELELQIKNLQQQIADWDKKSLDLNVRLENFEQLKEKISREQTLYNQFTANSSNVDLSKSMDQDDVIVTSPASAASVVQPNYPQQLMYGVLGGFVVGAFFIFCITRLDNRIKSPLEIMENFDLSILGCIPRTAVDKRKKRVPILTEDDPRHILMESHRNIRSSILTRPIKLRSFMIISAEPSEGKSTVASNLAVSFAFAGIKTLLIDADLRRGILHKLFETPSPQGMSEYLHHELPWRDVVQSTNVPNLHIIIRGKITLHAGDLFQGHALDVLAQESVDEFDMVMWDCPPILATNDGASICPKVEGVVVVVRVGKSRIELVRAAMEELTQKGAKMLGIIANAVEPQQPGYYTQYQYKEYYRAQAEA